MNKTILPTVFTEDDITRLPLIQLQQQLDTSRHGVSQSTVQQRLSQYGYNELPEESIRPWQQFLAHFWGPIPWMIEIAAILSALVQDWADLIIILALLIINALVGCWEEYEAGKAIAALKAQLVLKARVKRDGTWMTIPARELVPGDLIRLRLGDIVSADARLLAGDALEVDQSALTGESFPVTKPPGEVVYSGSIVKRGEIDALVYATGADAYFGKTARLVESTRPASILIFAVVFTQVIATIIAIYGLLMTPIGWGWALLVWGYCLIWLLINDRVKLEAYRLFDLGKPVMRVRRKVKRWTGRHLHHQDSRL